MDETYRNRTAEVVIRFSEFEFPPVQDVLVVGRRAPIGPEAARRMVDAISPEQYEIIPVDEGPIEALVVRKMLLAAIPRERLVAMLLEETAGIAQETSVLKARVNVDIVVTRKVDF